MKLPFLECSTFQTNALGFGLVGWLVGRSLGWLVGWWVGEWVCGWMGGWVVSVDELFGFHPYPF